MWCSRLGKVNRWRGPIAPKDCCSRCSILIGPTISAATHCLGSAEIVGTLHRRCASLKAGTASTAGATLRLRSKGGQGHQRRRRSDAPLSCRVNIQPGEGAPRCSFFTEVSFHSTLSFHGCEE